MKDIFLSVRSFLFYLKNKKKGLTKNFSWFLWDNKEEKIISIINKARNFEEVCNGLRQEILTGETNYTFFDLLASMPYGVFNITSIISFVDKNMASLYLQSQISVSEQREIIEKYKDCIFNYLQSTPALKNQFFRGNDKVKDLAKDITMEDLNFVIEKLFEIGNYPYSPEKNIYLIKNLLFEMETLYSKEILFSNPEFVKFEMEYGYFSKYIKKLKNREEIPNIEDRLATFFKEKNLTPDEKELLDNQELLLKRLKGMSFPGKEEVIFRLEHAIKNFDTVELLEVLKEYSMLYEMEFRKQIVSSLYTPTSSCLITDFRDVKPIMVHAFFRDPSSFFQKYMKDYKEKLIQERQKKGPDEKLTKEEEEKYQRHLEYAKKYLFNQTYVPETAQFESQYSDANGFDWYKSDTFNQLSTSVFGLSAILSKIGFYGIGFDSTTLPSENIAISSPIYLTTNKGLDNLEINLTESFLSASAPLDELLESSENEVVLFRKGINEFTHASYVFVIIRGEEDEYSIKKDKELIEKARKIAENNNMKLVIFDAFKIRQSYELNQNEIEKNQNKQK